MNTACTISTELPTGKNSTIGESVLVEAAALTKLHRKSRIPMFHRNENERFDVVMAKSNKNCDAIDVSEGRRTLVWIT